MPYLDGLELLKAVRGEKATCHIPVVVITGRPDEDSRLQATQLGVTRYLAKPVRLSDLMEAVEHSLGKSKSGKT